MYDVFMMYSSGNILSHKSCSSISTSCWTPSICEFFLFLSCFSSQVPILVDNCYFVIYPYKGMIFKLAMGIWAHYPLCLKHSLLICRLDQSPPNRHYWWAWAERAKWHQVHQGFLPSHYWSSGLFIVECFSSILGLSTHPCFSCPVVTTQNVFKIVKYPLRTKIIPGWESLE